MGYLKAKCTCRCDFCGGFTEIDLEDVFVQGPSVSWIELVLRKAEQGYAEHGGFFNEGDIYACRSCIEKAQDGVVLEFGDGALNDDDAHQLIYGWMDENIG